MNTGLVFFTVIVLQWGFTDCGSWPYSVLSVSSEDLKAIGIRAPSWLFGSWLGTDNRTKTSVEENENEGEGESESEQRILKTWNFIKKLKGKDEDEKPKKGKKKKKQDTGTPLLSGGFLSGLFGEEPAANETAVDDLSSNTTVVPPLLILNTSSSDLPLSQSDNILDVQTTKAPTVKIKKPANETSDENTDNSEPEDDEPEDDSDEEEEEEDDEDVENEDKKQESGGIDDPDDLILDTAPKGSYGSDETEPAELDMLGKKADLYIRLNKAHQSAKEFLDVFKGVYVDYIKLPPYIGIALGNRGRSFGNPSYGRVNRMGRPLNEYAVPERIYRNHQPKIYFPNYNDYHEYGNPPKHNSFLNRQYLNRNLVYPLRTPYGRERTERIFHFDYPYDYAPYVEELLYYY